MSAPWTFIYRCPGCDDVIAEGMDTAKDDDGETICASCGEGLRQARENANEEADQRRIERFYG